MNEWTNEHKGIEIVFVIQPPRLWILQAVAVAAAAVAFLISGAYNSVVDSVKKLHFAEQNYQSNRIKANVNNEANQKISGDSSLFDCREATECKSSTIHLFHFCLFFNIAYRLTSQAATLEQRLRQQTTDEQRSGARERKWDRW